MSSAGRAGAGAGEVHVDRILLRVAGLDEGAARELARLVAEGLAPGLLASAAGPGFRVVVAADAAERDPPDLLARRIVGEIGRVLARDRASGGPYGEVTG